MFQNISDFNDTSDYLPIFNASLIADKVWSSGASTGPP